MNWEIAAAVAEIIGAVAVVVTLLYVARELRHNSRSLAVTALRDTTSNWHAWSNMLATSGDLAEIVARGNRDPADLGESEALRYGAFVQSFFDNVESYRELVVEHKIEKNLEVLESIVRRRAAEKGVRAWWNDNVDDYDGEFVAWVNQVMKT
jgi:hypothetical protein